MPDPNLPASLISEEEIDRRVNKLGAEIDRDCASTDELILIGVLKGSFIFLADLARRLTVRHRVEFIAVSSYGDSEATEHSGAVRLIMDVRHDIADRDVLVVEDIVDSGLSLQFLQKMLSAFEPSSLRTATLLQKKPRLKVDVKVDFVGFDIEDKYVVGFGLDENQVKRNLRSIYVVD